MSCASSTTTKSNAGCLFLESAAARVVNIPAWVVSFLLVSKKMRKRESELNANWGTLCPPLELLAADGKRRQTQCANAEGLFRIIQSIPSPKAEPFKRWLAKVGYERLEEIENPELTAARLRELYQAKGYSDEQIGVCSANLNDLVESFADLHKQSRG